MSVTKIRLQNFRGFRDASIELKPLTVLLGPNSAGKSSFGHALAAMAHAHRFYRGTPQATLTPPASDADNWPVDLGRLSDLRTRGEEGPVIVGLGTGTGWVELGFGLDLTNDLVPSYFAVRGSGTSTVRPNTVVPSETASFEIRRINENQWQESGVASVVILDGLLVKGFSHIGGTAGPISQAVSAELQLLFNNLTYLRASRKRPSRAYRNEVGRLQRIGYAGEWTPSILKEKTSAGHQEHVAYAKLPEIPAHREGTSHRSSKWLLTRQSLGEAVESWLERLGLATSLESNSIEGDRSRLQLLVTLPGQKPRDITEIGFGVSQILPVLTAGLLQAEGSLFIVDLPEAHLHPRPQAAIADFFCSLALSGRFSLVETHSEMFFHRLRLRAEMIPELRDKVAVYFLDASSANLCCSPRRIGLSVNEEPNWPAGFFQEGWDMEVQISSLRRARKALPND